MWRAGGGKTRREGEISVRGLSTGSCLSKHTEHTAAFADVLLQSSCPINSIQPGRKRLSSNIQLESKHNQGWWMVDYRHSGGEWKEWFDDNDASSADISQIFNPSSVITVLFWRTDTSVTSAFTSKQQYMSPNTKAWPLIVGKTNIWNKIRSQKLISKNSTSFCLLSVLIDF